MKEKIAKALLYLTTEQAKAEGFTHSASYYGIPCWMQDPEGECVVATKWEPLEYLMEPISYIEGFFNGMMQREPTFLFKITGEI